ncbi:lysophospholipid acyltransferase family protein [Saccharicrinis sp. FJH54]|uniref:lysophospholipid acyltransferase family protein n=1 Tax=Saccharicrinis sp. FJH54 TaxID=3344665 RepID=UPI0035D47574
MMDLFDKDALQKYMGGPLKNPLIFNVAYQASGFPRINRLYKKYLVNQTGLNFIDASFETLNIKYVCPENDLKHIPKTGPFIVISNHPYGFLDGLILIRIFAERFEGFKVLANYFLRLFSPIADYFIEVDPFTLGKQPNKKGIKGALQHLQDGHPLGIFPSGDITTRSRKRKFVSSKEWNISSVKFIEKAGVPVIPVYFSGKNSRLYNISERINPILRTISLPGEFLRKRDEEVFFRIGMPLKPEDYIKQDSFATRDFLHSTVNALKYSSSEDKKILKLNLKFRVKKPEQIIEPVDRDVLEKEIAALPAEHKLMSRNEFDVFYASKELIPNVLTEIGRLREITFREVGEGTNRSYDLDDYDTYYDQLFVWNRVEKELLGGYRLGRGSHIMDRFGKKGFYITSLFDVDDELIPVFKQTIEMGRSFVVSKYQKKPLSLFLLWNGILKFVLRHNTHRYLMGPVSISNDFSRFSKELIMSFIRKYYFNTELATYIHPKMEFKVSGFREHEVESILASHKDDLKKLDNYISALEIQGMRIPVLIKKYLSQNARVVGFNVDPDFNYSLDGLMILDINDLPPESLETFNA